MQKQKIIGWLINVCFYCALTALLIPGALDRFKIIEQSVVCFVMCVHSIYLRIPLYTKVGR